MSAPSKDALSIRRIYCGSNDARLELARLREQLSSQGTVVSARGRELTRKVFGEDLTPIQSVERICADVRSQGREALLHYTLQFDRAQLTPDDLRVNAAELRLAHAAADSDFLQTIRRIRQRVLTFQSGILNRTATLSVVGKQMLQLRYRPVRRVGVLVPGGAASYPSTLLMTIVPAQAAGVNELAVVMPPTPFGAGNSDLLAVCHELGVTEVYRVGGAQAVAALAYGVEGIPAVDMIVGPGNLFVALAKRQVYGQVAIDCIAGPSEVVILADASARADYIAADLLAQAEHAPGASILVTWHEPLIEATATELQRQLGKLNRADLTRESLEAFGALVLARDEEEAIGITNSLGPEHLEVLTVEPEKLAERIDHVGAIFLGSYSPVAVGDYAAGPSHVLPTGGTARFASGLSANDFLCRSSVLSFTDLGLAELAEDVTRLAAKEGLTAHAASVTIRTAASSEDQLMR